ncbi:MAG: MBOAT family protein [Lachnospiraceae bacterium]|nr:MBOAT family protein [Lachnospiraceae bacterium]
MISFSSVTFLFRFLPVFLIIFYLTPAKYRSGVLFLGSMVFYALGEPVLLFVPLLLAMTVVNWLIGRKVPGRGRVLALGVLLDVGLLAAAKVLAVTAQGFALPIGISFYLFKMISYQADRYKGKIKDNPGFFTAAAYFTMFPQIAQGPIMRFEEGFGEEAGFKPSAQSLEDGLTALVMGLGMKLLVADRIGILWNEIGKIGYADISTPLAWMGAFAYSFQLYFDFWGYSLMAGGIGMMLGLPFIRNFDHPYAARGIADFYRRWHMTLGAFFRDYVYIPFGGSREGTVRTIRNLLDVWVLTGLWHGGSLNFVLWGLILFAVIVWEKFAVRGLLEKVPLIAHLHVILLIPLTWMVFAISDLQQLAVYFGRLFPIGGSFAGANATDFAKYAGQYWPMFIASVILCIPKVYQFAVDHRRKWYMVLLLLVLFWVCIYTSVNSAANPFMYLTF